MINDVFLQEALKNGKLAHYVIDMQVAYVDCLDEAKQKSLPQQIQGFIVALPDDVKTTFWAVPIEDYSMSMQELDALNVYTITNADGTPVQTRQKTDTSLFRYKGSFSEGVLPEEDRKVIVFTGINKAACVLESALDAIRKGHTAIIIDDLTADRAFVETFNAEIGQRYSANELAAMDLGVVYMNKAEFMSMLGVPDLNPLSAPKAMSVAPAPAP